MERMKNWTKSTLDWFNKVFYNGDMCIRCATRMHNEFQVLQKQVGDIIDICKEFLEMYRITYPKLESILKLSKETGERELVLPKEDHQLVEAQQLNFEYRKEILEKASQELEADDEWIMKHPVNRDDYLKMMTSYEMPALELDPEAIKREFHMKMEQGVGDTLSPNFMDFIARSFIESKKILRAIPKCTKHWDQITKIFERVAFHITKSDLSKENNLLVVIGNFLEYATTQKEARKPIIDDEYLLKQL